MSIQTAGQGARAAHDAVRVYQEQEEELARTLSEVQRDLSELKGRIQAAVADLAHAFLPAADEAAVAAAAAATGNARLPDLLAGLRQAHERRLARRAEIEASAEFRDRELLLHPTTGTLAQQVAEADENLRASSPTVARYEAIGGFRTLHARHGKPPVSPAVKLLGRIFLIGFILEWGRRDAERRLLEAFPGSTVERCMSDYEEARRTRDFWEAEAKKRRAEKVRVEDLVREHETLGAEVAAFEESARASLRGELARYLAGCEAFEEIRAGAGPGARVAASSVLALKQKEAYLQRMAGYLHREVVDRQQQQHKLRTVAGKWQRNPGKRLSGDKTAWLVTGPARKAESTRRQVTKVHKVKTAIIDFDDWELYDRVLDDDEVLAWDVFARASDERMPGDDFVAEMIPDVGEYREEHGAPDYRSIDDAASSLSASAVAGVAAAGIAVSALAASELVADEMDGEWMDGEPPADEADAGDAGEGEDAGMEDVS